jgi:isoleucyl-tRNA synthetase
LKTRQPLPAVTLVTADPALPERVKPYADLLEDELNVKEIRWAADRSLYVHHEVRPIYPKLGPRLGKGMAEVKQALLGADGNALAHELETNGKVRLALASGPVELSAEEVEIRLIEREGMATQGDSELLVALDTTITDALRDEGWAREVVHAIQTERKDQGLEYSDRIRLHFASDDALTAALLRPELLEMIRRETLAVEVKENSTLPTSKPAQIEGQPFAFAIEKV